MLQNFDSPPDFAGGQIILIDKPLHWTSFDVVNKLRHLIRKGFHLKDIKVGHAGTLDPLATGLLIVCTGKSTKKIIEIQDTEKEYEALVEFGKTTPSYDLETAFDAEYPYQHIDIELVEQKLKSLLGESLQSPPIHSARFVNGKRAYELARKGKEVELKSHRIVIHEIELLEWNKPAARIRVRCSKGTYIRSLAYDLGILCGSGAYLKGLRRTRIGPWNVDQAWDLEQFEKKLKDFCNPLNNLPYKGAVE